MIAGNDKHWRLLCTLSEGAEGYHGGAVSILSYSTHEMSALRMSGIIQHLDIFRKECSDRANVLEELEHRGTLTVQTLEYLSQNL